MHSFFSVENKLFYNIGKVTDVLWISLLWVVCTLPIVTLGPSLTALYYTVKKCIREREERMTEKFFQNFRENFKTAMTAGIFMEALLFLLWLGCDVMAKLAGTEGKSMAVALTYTFFVLFLFLIGVMCYTFPLLARFEFRAGELLAVSFQMAVRHFPVTVLMTAMVSAAVILTVFLWIPVFIVPALMTLLCSFLLEHIFKKYLPSPETEEGSA